MRSLHATATVVYERPRSPRRRLEGQALSCVPSSPCPRCSKWARSAPITTFNAALLPILPPSRSISPTIHSGFEDSQNEKTDRRALNPMTLLFSLLHLSQSSTVTSPSLMIPLPSRWPRITPFRNGVSVGWRVGVSHSGSPGLEGRWRAMLEVFVSRRWVEVWRRTSV